MSFKLGSFVPELTHLGSTPELHPAVRAVVSLNRLKSKMGIQLKVNGPRGEEKIIDMCDNEEQLKKITVMNLKRKIASELRIIDDIRMVFRTENLEESSLLSSYGIKHMSTIHTLLMLPGGV